MKVHPQEILDILKQIQTLHNEVQLVNLQRNISYIINRIYNDGIGEENQGEEK
jgi:hypothetical protein